jgi:hypothetical protein
MAYLSHHHMAVENAFTPILGAVDSASNARNNRGTNGDVGNKMAVHDINMQPVSSGIVHNAATFV